LAAIVLTLGIGLGAAAAIFSLLNAIVLRPLPFHDADRLFVQVSASGGPPPVTLYCDR
jgi:putative ABC transport system permease protein